MDTKFSIDRLAMRSKPTGSPVMQQNWDNLLFLHWPVDAAQLRPLIPSALEIDTFEGQAWLSMTPFSLTGLRLFSLPPVPGLDSFLELNVRTYVHRKGIPGVWFFSLDASKLIPVVAARLLFTLPYHRAEMSFSQEGNEFRFHSRRLLSPYAELRAHWRTGLTLRDPDVHSLAFFLVERYCLFAGTGNEIAMTRVYHHPWILEEAVLLSFESTMLQPLHLADPASAPVAHFSRTLNVDIWAPEPV